MFNIRRRRQRRRSDSDDYTNDVTRQNSDDNHYYKNIKTQLSVAFKHIGITCLIFLYFYGLLYSELSTNVHVLIPNEHLNQTSTSSNTTTNLTGTAVASSSEIITVPRSLYWLKTINSIKVYHEAVEQRKFEKERIEHKKFIEKVQKEYERKMRNSTNDTTKTDQNDNIHPSNDHLSSLNETLINNDNENTNTTNMKPFSSIRTDVDAGLDAMTGLLLFTILLRIILGLVIYQQNPQRGLFNSLFQRIPIRQRQTQQRTSTRTQRIAQLHQQLNTQRIANGANPISLQSFTFLIQNARTRDFNSLDYDQLWNLQEDNGNVSSVWGQVVGATEREIQRCPERVIEVGDDLIRSTTSTDLELGGGGNDTTASVHQHGIVSSSINTNNNHEENSSLIPAEIGDDTSAHHKRCPICLEHFQLGDTVRTIPCFHCFHSSCIDPWLREKSICPICKHSAIG